MNREDLGKLVREIWIEWAKEQPAPKPSWLVEWEGLSEPDKEVDRRIGERIYSLAIRDAANVVADFRDKRLKLAAECASPNLGHQIRTEAMMVGYAGAQIMALLDRAEGEDVK